MAKTKSIRIDFGEDMKGRPISYYYTLVKSKPPIGSLYEGKKITDYVNENRKVAKYAPDLAKRYLFYRIHIGSIMGIQIAAFIAVPKKDPA